MTYSAIFHWTDTGNDCQDLQIADTGCILLYFGSSFGGSGFSCVAPRAVRGAIHSQQGYEVVRTVGMNLEEPGVVAGHILQAMRRRREECYIGFPESLFVRIDALLSGPVDRAVRGQSRVTAICHGRRQVDRRADTR